MLRVEEQQGRSRFAKWLAELIQAEAATDALEWSSSALTGFPQRFQRAAFCKLMMEEIVKLKAKEGDEGLLPAAPDGTELLVVPQSLHAGKATKEERRKASLINFTQRKRARQQPEIDRAMALKGARIEVRTRGVAREGLVSLFPTHSRVAAIIRAGRSLPPRAPGLGAPVTRIPR